MAAAMYTHKHIRNHIEDPYSGVGNARRKRGEELIYQHAWLYNVLGARISLLDLVLGSNLVKFICLGAELGGILLSTNPLVATVRTEKVIPPTETCRVAAKEGHVVVVVVVRTRPEWNPVVQTNREVVTRVSIDRLEQTEHDPNVYGQDMQVLGIGTQQEWATNGAETQDQDFQRMCILGRKTERCNVLMVDLVNVLVQRTIVHCTVRPVMECIFEHKEQCDLPQHLSPAREWHLVRRQAEVLTDGMKTPDLRKLNSKVTKKHKTRTSPLISERWHIVLNQRVSRYSTFTHTEYIQAAVCTFALTASHQ